MTDALSEHAREQREEREQTQPPASKRPRHAPRRPVYQFPDSPSTQELKQYDDFVGSCRQVAFVDLGNDFVEAGAMYEQVFKPQQGDLSDAERVRVILDIASRITAERHREQRRRCAVSVGASMQD